tara:strand:- start:17060 stop:17233 length:174 start_codon:yes stop_codon:yes gene_type:complete
MGCRISIKLAEHLSPKTLRKSSDSATSPIPSPLLKKRKNSEDDTVCIDLDAPDNEYI